MEPRLPDPPCPPRPPRPPWRRALLLAAQTLVALLILLDEIARPLYRPVARWLSERAIVARMEAAIGAMPRFVILALLAIPFAVAEPLKIAGVVLIGRGRLMLGATVLVIAYLASFLIVERIYHAGRARLLTIGWFAFAMGRLSGLRERLLAWVRASAAYAFAARLRLAARDWWRSRRA